MQDSVNNIGRHRAMIGRYVVSLNSRLAPGSGNVRELEDRMSEVLQLYGQQLRARAEQPHKEEKSAYYELGKKWSEWSKRARYRNAEIKIRGSMRMCANTNI